MSDRRTGPLAAALPPPWRPAVLAGIRIFHSASAICVSNDQVCPLTPLAEPLGAAPGAVADMFLPERVSRRIPAISSEAMLAGIGLDLLAW